MTHDRALAIIGGVGFLICGMYFFNTVTGGRYNPALRYTVPTTATLTNGMATVHKAQPRKVDDDPYHVEGQQWATIDIRVMGADGKACDIVFGRKNTPMSVRFLDHTNCPANVQSGVIHGFRGYEDAAK